LALHQQTADELGGNLLGGAGEEALGEVLGECGGYGSGLGDGWLWEWLGFWLLGLYMAGSSHKPVLRSQG